MAGPLRRRYTTGPKTYATLSVLTGLGRPDIAAIPTDGQLDRRPQAGQVHRAARAKTVPSEVGSPGPEPCPSALKPPSRHSTVLVSQAAKAAADTVSCVPSLLIQPIAPSSWATIVLRS